MGAYDVSFEWDDSILIDEESELSTRLSLIGAGLAGKVETRMWYFGETQAQAEQALNEISEENRLAIEQNMVMSSQMGKQIGGGNNRDKQENESQSGEATPNNPQKQPVSQENANVKAINRTDN